MDFMIQKGSRIEAQYFQVTTPSGALAGNQLKTSAILQQITGVVRHIRADDPQFTVNVTVHVQTDDNSGEVCRKCGCREVTIKPGCITKVVSL
jgi:hypothetical protein